MLSIDTIAIFFPAAVLLALAPGPDNIFVMTQSAMHGRIAGLFVTLGLCSGLMVHTLAVSLGVAALFKASAIAFTVLKLCGAGYLLYLAWGAFRAGRASLEARAVAGTFRTLYLRGLAMNVTNPKVAIFFLAFLPQFARPEDGALVPQLVSLGALMALATMLVFGSIAFGAGALGGWLRQSPGAQLWINRAAGAVFVGLALKLATTQR